MADPAEELAALMGPDRNPRLNALQNYARNAPFTGSGRPAASYDTKLDPMQEMAFRQWTRDNKVPFDSNAQNQDYDMRGFYQGLQQGDPRAQSAVDPNDNRLHYPDTWKTPYHETFSADSQYANKDAPQWNDKDQLIDPSGRVVFDDRRK